MNTTPARSIRHWLVVDDNAPLAGLLTLTLGGLGLAHVEGFTSAREAYTRAREGGVNLVVTDRDMPGIDGLELARLLHAESPETKIVLITAHTDDLSAEDLRRAGVCAVLPKPFSIERLEALVRALTCELAPSLASFDSAVARRAA